jgi:hypothetical protein
MQISSATMTKTIRFGPVYFGDKENGGDEKGGVLDPAYSLLYNSNITKLLKNFSVDNKVNDKVNDPKSYKKRAANPAMEFGQDVTLHYCTETGRSFYARPLIRTEPNNPRDKRFFCLICWKATKGKPKTYRKLKSWHYTRITDYKLPGYTEQAVLTAIEANFGKDFSCIAKYCEDNFKDGSFSYGNVRHFIEQYAKRDFINIENGLVKNKKLVC